jgi:hypothetical protein
MFCVGPLNGVYCENPAGFDPPAYETLVKFGDPGTPIATSTGPASGDALMKRTVPREGASGFTLVEEPLHALSAASATVPSSTAPVFLYFIVESILS